MKASALQIVTILKLGWWYLFSLEWLATLWWVSGNEQDDAFSAAHPAEKKKFLFVVLFCFEPGICWILRVASLRSGCRSSRLPIDAGTKLQSNKDSSRPSLLPSTHLMYS